MKIKIFKDLKQYSLTSTIKTADIELLKKYRPAALKKQDEEGNDIFGVSYLDGKPCVSANGITFGATSAEGKFAMITGAIPADLPANVTAGDWVADKVGAALTLINEFEEKIPGVVAEIKAERKALIDGIEEV